MKCPPFDGPLTAYQEQAESLFAALMANDEAAQWRFKWMHPRFKGKHVNEVKAMALTLDDARLLIARESFFNDWDALKAFSEAVQRDGPIRRFEQAVEAVICGDIDAVKMMLQKQPELVQSRSTRSHHATLLHYTAANGVENVRQKTPANAVEVTKLLLEAGAEVDALADMYDNKCTTMSMLVSSCHPHEAGLQVTLAKTLLDYGAAFDGPGSNWSSSVMTALLFGYLETAEALVRRGAKVDHIAIAAGLGRTEDVTRLLPSSNTLARHQALALAAQLGQASAVKQLLDAGEEPNRFNPDGYHSHATPLHQAVWSDHLAVVKLLIERGARLDLRDTLFDGTPLDWAKHGQRTDIVNYLQELK